jgi:hypothetical protein
VERPPTRAHRRRHSTHMLPKFQILDRECASIGRVFRPLVPKSDPFGLSYTRRSIGRTQRIFRLFENNNRGLAPSAFMRSLSARRLVSLLTAMLLVWVLSPLTAQPAMDSDNLERRIKAAFLYKFADFVEWPDSVFTSPAAPIVIGVMHDDALATELADATANRTVAGRRLLVRRIKESETAPNIHILFVGGSGNARLASLLAPFVTLPTLAVTESESGLPPGSVINFRTASGRVRFEIALDSAEKRGLRLSSRLLTVAQSVRTTGAQP